MPHHSGQSGQYSPMSVVCDCLEHHKPLAIAAFEYLIGYSHSANWSWYMFSVYRTCAIYECCSSWYLMITASHLLFPSTHPDLTC